MAQVLQFPQRQESEMKRLGFQVLQVVAIVVSGAALGVVVALLLRYWGS